MTHDLDLDHGLPRSILSSHIQSLCWRVLPNSKSKQENAIIEFGGTRFGYSEDGRRDTAAKSIIDG